MTNTPLWQRCYLHRFDVPRRVSEKPSNHDLNNTVHSVYSPFRFYWRDVEIPSEKKRNAQQPCWDETQDWLTATVTCDIHWRSLHIYFLNAMQWDARSRLSLTGVGWCCLPKLEIARHYHHFHILMFIIHRRSSSQKPAAALFECRNTRRWKIIWNHFILRVCGDSIFAGKLQTEISV